MKKIFILYFLLFFFSIGNAQSSWDPYPLQPVVWDSLGSPPGSVSFFAEKDGRLWVANGNLFFSDDQGLTWEQHPQFAFNDVDKVFSTDFGITVTRRKLEGCQYINNCSQFLIYLSTDGGEQFVKSDLEPFYISITTHSHRNSLGVIKKSEKELIYYDFFSGTSADGIFFYGSLDGGLTWEGLGLSAYNNFFSPDISFHGTADTLSGLFSASDSTWQLNVYSEDYSIYEAFFIDKYENESHKAHAYINDRLIIINNDGTLLYTDNLEEDLIPVMYPFTNLEDISKVEFGEKGIFLLAGSDVWYISYDDLNIANLVFSADSSEDVFFHESSSVFFVSDQTGLYLSEDSVQNLVKRDKGIIGEIFDLQVVNNIIWANTGRWFRSDDLAESWVHIEDGPLYEGGEILKSFNDWIFLRKDTVLYRADANGILWDSVLVFDDEFKILETEDGLYFYDHESIIYTQDGNTFLERNPPVENGQYVFWEGQLICLANNEKFTSLDQGQTWSDGYLVHGDHSGEIALVNGELVAIDMNIGNYNKSSDGGDTWINVTFIYQIFIASTGASALPATFHGHYNGIGFFNSKDNLLISANNGYEWGALPGPYITSHIRAFQGFYFENLFPFPLGVEFGDETIFTYTSEQGIFSTPIGAVDSQLSQVIITSVDDQEKIKFDFKIQPNPTNKNPTLIFKTGSLIELQADLFGVDGIPIRKIINKKIYAIGDHSIKVNMDGLPDGMYFLRLRTGQENRWVKIIYLDEH